MRTLVIDTATAACSVALIEDGAVVDQQHEVVNRGHAERLLPMIAALPAGGRADRILVDCGPGSFTGVRVGVAAALALGMGWQAPVAGYSSLAVVAVAAFADRPDLKALAVVLEGGHGEVFMQLFTASPLSASADLASLTPDRAADAIGDLPVIGSGLRYLASIAAERRLGDALPRAADAIMLPPSLTSLPPRPLYGRAPDAKPIAEQRPA